MEAVIKGLNIATKWEFKSITVLIDSTTVFGWLTSLVIGDKPIRVRGLEVPLVRRHLSLIEDLVKEYNLVIKLSLVKSAENKAVALTRIPRDWLQSIHSAVAINVSSGDVKSFHNLHRFGVNRTLYLMKPTYPEGNICRDDEFFYN